MHRCTYLPHLLVSAYLLIIQNLRHSVMQLLSHILHKTNISWWNVVWFSWEKKIFMCNIKRAMHIRLGKVNQSSNFITKKNCTCNINIKVYQSPFSWITTKLNVNFIGRVQEYNILWLSILMSGNEQRYLLWSNICKIRLVAAKIMFSPSKKWVRMIEHIFFTE